MNRPASPLYDQEPWSPNKRERARSRASFEEVSP